MDGTLAIYNKIKFFQFKIILLIFFLELTRNLF